VDKVAKHMIYISLKHCKLQTHILNNSSLFVTITVCSVCITVLRLLTRETMRYSAKKLNGVKLRKPYRNSDSRRQTVIGRGDSGESVALLVARRTNNRKVVGSRPILK